MLHFLRVLIYLILPPMRSSPVYSGPLPQQYQHSHLFVIWCQDKCNKCHGRLSLSFKQGHLVYLWSLITGFMQAVGIEVTPAYLKKQCKSAAASKTEAGGKASDNSMHGNEASAQQAQFKDNQPTQRGPAFTVHEWTDELSGVVYFSMKSPSHYWHCQLDDKKLLLVHQSDKEWELQGVQRDQMSDRSELMTVSARCSSPLPVTTPLRSFLFLSLSLFSPKINSIIHMLMSRRPNNS